jgi:hypothetical protein
MGILTEYQPIYKEARHLQYRAHDMLRSDHPSVRILHKEVEGLMTDLETSRNPRDVENRIKMIQNQMHQIEHQGNRLMSLEHGESMHHDFENMRRTVRTFHDY